MQVKDIEQGSADWHNFRKGGIGSSDISILLGSYPFRGKTALTLFEDKTSALIEHADSYAMAYGREEEVKALEFLRKTDPTLRAACAIHEDYDFIRCSFDALGKDTFYEIKSPYSLEILEKALMGDPQKYWLDQVRWQLFISGFAKGNLVVWDGSRPHISEIEKDAEWEENALQVAKEFWERMLLGLRPEASDQDYIEVDDPECADFLQEYYSLCEKEKELKKYKDMVKAKIIDKGPDHNFIVNGVKIYQQQTTSYDFSRMKQDGINVDSYKKVSHPFWMIAPKRAGRACK